jgi:hypothetical protein
VNPKHLHTPVSTRVRCPVCHHAVYSRAGIHPQCAMLLADPPRLKSKASQAPGPGKALAVAAEPAPGEDPPPA